MKSINIIGGGAAGLMAADYLAEAGYAITIYDSMSSLGRKFLMAGRGGLNLTHSEPLDSFITRYGAAAFHLEPAIRHYTSDELRAWCHDLGMETFVGTSGRVFPKCLKASPLLRALLQRLNKNGVQFKLKHLWTGWDAEQNLTFTKPDGTTETAKSEAVLLALGGASWPRLGSTGDWMTIMADAHIPITPFVPSNCGFIVPWSSIFAERFQGQAIKPLTLTFGERSLQGEAMITAKGIEGGAIYALSGLLRDGITTSGEATLYIDLRPGLSLAELTHRLNEPRGSQSLTNHLRKQGGLSPVATGLLYETQPVKILQSMAMNDLTQLIKSCPIKLTATTGLDRAISSAGGIQFNAIDDYFMLRNKPGVFVAGEMLDWEAPTGGYLLQACFSTAVAAADGIKRWVDVDANI
jgi:hypothetical protein